MSNCNENKEDKVIQVQVTLWSTTFTFNMQYWGFLLFRERPHRWLKAAPAGAFNANLCSFPLGIPVVALCVHTLKKILM